MTHAEGSTNAKGSWTIFDGTNYQAWKAEVTARLIDKKCYKVVAAGVDPTIPMFAGSDDEYVSSASSSDDLDDVATKDRKKLKKESKRQNQRKKKLMQSGRSPFLDNRAKVLIMSALSMPIRQLISSAETAKDMWKILQDEYESSDYVSVGKSIREFYGKDYKAGASIDDHINKMKSVWIEINNKWKGTAAAKVKQRRPLQVLGSRPHQRARVRSSAAPVGQCRGRKDQVTMDEICSALRAATPPSGGEKRTHGDINWIGSKTGRPDPRKKQQRNWCYICRTEGHQAESHPDFDPEYKKNKQQGSASKTDAEPPAEKSAEGLYRGASGDSKASGARKIDLDKGSINMLRRKTNKTVNFVETDEYNNEFILDNGAQCHTTGESRWFSNLKDTHHQIEFPNGETAQGQKGTLCFKVDEVTLVVGGATYCPAIRRNILSMHKLLRRGFVVVEFTMSNVVLFHEEHDLSLIFHQRGGLYRIAVEPEVHQINAIMCVPHLGPIEQHATGGFEYPAQGVTSDSVEDMEFDDATNMSSQEHRALWHRRFNHANDDAINHALPGIIC